MQIETYEQTEVTELGEEDREAALDLARELGLEGQVEVMGDGDAPCPYAELTEQQAKILDLLFPSKANVEDYKRGPIPLRVLQAVAFCRGLRRDGEDYFDRLVVRYPRTESESDPVLLGRVGSTYYLIARWGDALESWAQLAARAAVLAIDKRRISLNEIAAQIQAKLAALDSVDLSAEGALELRTDPTFWD